MSSNPGEYDVVHVHEPITPLGGWATCWFAGLPLVGTFHSYSTSWLPNAIGNALGARGRCSTTCTYASPSPRRPRGRGARWFGGHYRVIPNGVRVDPLAAVRAAARTPEGPLRIVFVGQAVERKGLPMLLRAFEALREHSLLN